VATRKQMNLNRNFIHKEISKYGKLIILLICIFYFIYSLKNYDKEGKKYLSGDCVWTIAKTIKAYGENEYIGYKYFVNGKLFYSSVGYESIPAELDHFYLIKYSKIKPEINEIYFDKEITDRIKIRKTGYKVINENIGSH
jgi:hypothetical protein